MQQPRRPPLAVFLLTVLVFMSSATAQPVSAQVPDDFDGFRVEGRHLYDTYDNRVILVGVNKMVIWTDRDGLPAFPEIAKTGANTVRIAWLTEGSAEELDIAISNAITHKLIPIVDCHDSTGEWEKLTACVDYWVRPDVAAVLRRHQSYLLLNIANEAGRGVLPPLQFRSAYELAIRRIRAVGLHMPLVIDAQGFGQSINDLQKNGPYLITADPDHNLMFSIHMWWPSSQRGAGIKQTVIDEIAESVEMELPLLIGEFAHKGPGCSCCIPYETIIGEAHRNEIGYLPWSWGPGNGDCDEMDMTEDGTFETLHAWGLEVAITSTHSIQAIAIRPDWIVAGTPVPPPTPAPTPTPLPAPRGVLSTDHPIEVSSTESAGLVGANAADGRLDTRWASEYTDPQELIVDLGEIRDIARIVLEWEAAFGKAYKLQISDDGTEWQDLVHVTDGDGEQDDHIVTATGRYVKMLGLERGTEWGYSLWEFWVFEDASVPLPQLDEMAQVSADFDARPDLIVSDISWSPEEIYESDAVIFRATVTNQGNSAVHREPPVTCIFQINGETVASGTLSKPLAPEASAVIEGTTGPNGVARRHPASEQAFVVLAWVDPGDTSSTNEGLAGAIDELDETNNMATAYDTVQTGERPAQLDETEVAEPSITPADKMTPDPLMTTAPTPAEPGVLISTSPPSWDRLIIPALLVGAGAVLVIAIVLRRRSRE